MERTYNNDPIIRDPDERKKRILVAGAGAAGLLASVHLKRRGHEVILCEKCSIWGGQYHMADSAPSMPEMADAVHQMARTAQQEGVDIWLDTEVTWKVIRELKPDEIIVATGPMADSETTTDLIEALKEMCIPFHVIGAARQPGMPVDSACEAARVAQLV